jgi:hypothetical protein
MSVDIINFVVAVQNWYVGCEHCKASLILSFRRVLNVICFLLVFPRRLSANSRRFGTLYRFHLQRQFDEV